MGKRLSTIGRPAAMTATGVALAGMVAITVASGGASAAEDGPPMPSAGPSETQESSHAGPIEDRDPHSFAPTMPKDVCSDSTTCGFAEVH